MMTFSSSPRLSEPLVSRNSFRERAYQATPIPSLANAANRLPLPVLPNRPDWVEMYWRAWEIAWSRLRRPRGSSTLVANWLHSGPDGQISAWHTAFVTLFAVYARRAVNVISALDNFYARQHSDGFICRDIATEQTADLFQPFDPNSTGPNILAWAEWRYFRVSGDDSRLEHVFWPLMALHRWYRLNRTWPNGLYWATGLSSGMPDQERVPGGAFHHRHWTWVDANMQALLDCAILGQMATLLKQEEWVQELSQERSALAGDVNSSLWNEQAAFYQDTDARGRFSHVKSIGAYWALLNKDLLPAERLDAFLRPLRDANLFRRPHRVPSLAANSEGYDSETGSGRRGAVWSPTNYMLLKGLRLQGQHALAHEIAVNHLEHLSTVYQHTDTFWENYSPEKAEPGEQAQPNYVGWTGLSPISILLEDVIGISVDWPLRRVVWDRRWQSDEPYGVRNYPLGLDGTVDLLGDRENVTVTCDVSFTLTVQDDEQSLQTAVPAGTTEIPLS
jgi:hypothetical protein